MTQIIKNEKDAAQIFSGGGRTLNRITRESQGTPRIRQHLRNCGLTTLGRRFHDTHAVEGDLSVPIVYRVKVEDIFMSIKKVSSKLLSATKISSQK